VSPRVLITACRSNESCTSTVQVGGPRLPVQPFLKRTDRALVIPSVGAIEPVFIDCGGANSPFSVPALYPAAMVACSTQPNARIEKWAVPDAASGELQERMWLVATEPIAAGAEVRVDVKTFDGALRRTRLREHDWRSLRLALLPPSGEEPVYDGLASHGAGFAKAAVAEASPSLDGDGEHAVVFRTDDEQYLTASPFAPLRWEGPGGGDERLATLLPQLSKVGGQKFAIVATHVHGRSAEECRARWELLQAQRPAKEKAR